MKIIYLHFIRNLFIFSEKERDFKFNDSYSPETSTRLERINYVKLFAKRS